VSCIGTPATAFTEDQEQKQLVKGFTLRTFDPTLAGKLAVPKTCLPGGAGINSPLLTVNVFGSGPLGGVGVLLTYPDGSQAGQVTPSAEQPEQSTGFPSAFSQWKYRVPITVDYSAGAADLSNFQLLVSLDTATPIGAGKMRSDAGDLRFTDSDGQTALPSWIEGGINTSSTPVWVKLSVKAGSVKTIYAYYGNPSVTFDGVTAGEAPQLSPAYAQYDNGASVFDFYDNFEGTALDPTKWVVGVGTAGGTITVNNGLTSVSKGATQTTLQSLNAVVPPTAVVEHYSETPGIGSPDNLGWGFVDANENPTTNGYFNFFNQYTSAGFSAYFREGTGYVTQLFLYASFSYNTFYVVGMVRNGSTVNPAVNYQNYASGTATFSPSSALYLIMPRVWIENTPDTGTVITQWVRVRKFAATVPAVTVGSEYQNLAFPVPPAGQVSFQLRGSGVYTVSFFSGTNKRSVAGASVSGAANVAASTGNTVSLSVTGAASLSVTLSDTPPIPPVPTFSIASLGSSTQSGNDPNEQHMFIAAALFWAFYSDGTNMVYQFSADGVNWSAPQVVTAGVTHGFSCSVWFDGTYLHYAAAKSSGVVYRRGVPNADGTITWSAPEQAVTSNSSNVVAIAVDSSGYPWIAQGSSAGGVGLIYADANNDGTWAARGGFPVNLGSVARCGVIALTSRKVLVFWQNSSGTIGAMAWNGSGFNATVTGATALDDTGGGVCGLYTGTDVAYMTSGQSGGVSAVEIFDYASNTMTEVFPPKPQTYPVFGMVAGSGQFYLFYLATAGSSQNTIYYVTFNVASKTWSPEQNIVTTSSTEVGSPSSRIGGLQNSPADGLMLMWTNPSNLLVVAVFKAS
jgi:hypothetical protein